MSEEMKKNVSGEELNKEQLENVTGAGDDDSYELSGNSSRPAVDPDPLHPKRKKPTTDSTCPVCGAPKWPVSYGRPNVCPQCNTPYEQ